MAHFPHFGFATPGYVVEISLYWCAVTDVKTKVVGPVVLQQFLQTQQAGEGVRRLPSSHKMIMLFQLLEVSVFKKPGLRYVFN
jgi:hypothetical protein